MISFSRRGIFESIKYWLLPSYRKRCDDALRERIKYLMDHPEEPCMVEGNLVPNGYGEWKWFL